MPYRVLYAVGPDVQDLTPDTWEELVDIFHPFEENMGAGPDEVKRSLSTQFIYVANPTLGVGVIIVPISTAQV